jgi:hypothetical protein
MTNKTLKGGESILRLIITITFFISLAYAQTSKIVWMNYPASGCITCHRIASVKMNDTLYIFGTFHYTDRMNPFLIAVDSSLNVKWYRAFSHSLSNLAIDKMVKIDNNLIAISGGHSPNSQCPNRDCTFFGIFNIKTQDFVWAKYRQTGPGGWHLSATAIDFDGNNLVIGAQSSINSRGSWLLKVDLNGNILWQKIIYIEEIFVWDFLVMDVAFDGSSYIYLIHSKNSTGLEGGPTLVKFDLNGNLIWAKNYDFGPYDYPYKLLKDGDGYVVVGLRCWSCSTLNNDDIFVFKTDTGGNIIWSKLYSSSVAGWSNRAYNIALDYDGNYLVSGFIRASSNSSYPIVLKINRDNGDLIWSRIWDTPPQNTSSNQAKGVISIGQGKFYLLTFIGSGTDASGGFAIIREDTTGGESSCTKIITSISVSHITPSVSNFNVNINNASYSLNNLSLTPYSPSINQTNSCEITPISNYEFYKSCSFEIRANRGYIDIKLKEKNNVIVYDITGNVVYSEFFEGERKVRVKDGIYIIKVGNERVKVIVK